MHACMVPCENVGMHGAMDDSDGRNIRQIERWTIPHGVVATRPNKIQSLLVVSALIVGKIHANDDVTKSKDAKRSRRCRAVLSWIRSRYVRCELKSSTIYRDSQGAQQDATLGGKVAW